MRVSLIAEHGRVLGVWKPASTISPRNSVCSPTLDGLTHLAVDVGDRLVEDRRAGGAVVEREPVERARVEIDLDRLRELAHDRPVLLRRRC